MITGKALAITAVALLLAGCSGHNDQRSCTHDCHISGPAVGGTGPAYVAPIYPAPVYVAPAPIYRYGTPQYWNRYGPRRYFYGGGTVIIR